MFWVLHSNCDVAQMIVNSLIREAVVYGPLYTLYVHSMATQTIFTYSMVTDVAANVFAYPVYWC